jgi:hypothetical protein
MRPPPLRRLAAPFDRHYVYHTAWAARVLAHSRPRRRVDSSSSLFLSAIASAWLDIAFYDYRPPPLVLDRLSVGCFLPTKPE